MGISEQERYKLKRLIKEMEGYRGRHTELVTVYIPQGYEITKIINHLSQEQGTATNIKSTATRKNVIDALERMIQHLRLFKQTPPNGLVVFSGNVAEREGQSEVKVWSVEPPVPLKIRIYRCDKEFVLDPLKDMIEDKDIYGLVIVDRRDAIIAILKGKAIIPLMKTHSEVPGKTRAGGQCLVKDSLIQLHDGSLPKIESVHNPNIVKSVMIKNKLSIKDSNITDKWNVKKNQVYKIITKNPRLEVKSSKDHMFFVANTKGIIEKFAEELKKGDLLIMPEKIDIKGKKQKLDYKKYYNSFMITEDGRKLIKKQRSKKKLYQKQLAKKIDITQTAISLYELGKRNIDRKTLKRLCKELDINFRQFLNEYVKPYKYREIKLPKELNKEFSQFLGHYIGDGCIEKDRITFFEQDEKVAMNYKKKYDSLFNINSSYKFRENKNYHQLRFTSRPLVRLIKNEFPELKKASDSEIPQKVLQSQNRVVSAFLKGFFDAEGFVHSNRGVSLGINNKKLAQQIQMALLRFSIISSVHEYDNRANKYSNNPRFTVDITEKKSLELFKKNISFSCIKKLKRLNKVINKKSDKSNVRQIIYPGSYIRKIIENSGYNLQLFPKFSSFFNNKRMMSKEIFMNSVLKNIKDKKLYNKLKIIYDYQILPIKINSISKSNKKVEMVDITVKNQNFIANGILVHNSAQRFERLRAGAAKDHYKKVAQYVKEQFLENKDLKGIIVGGPGPSKYDWVEKGYLTDQLKQKIIAIKDLSYTGDFGLQELVDRSQDVLAEEEVAKEKKIMAKFFELLSTKPKMVAYGEADVKRLLEIGAVETLLLSEKLDDDIIEGFEDKAQELGTDIRIISVETREGAQLRDIGKIAAILRYEAGE